MRPYEHLSGDPGRVLIIGAGNGNDVAVALSEGATSVDAVESPLVPRNPYVAFMLEQFGRPKRNAAVQCDCERDANPSVLQVMSLANHPRLLQKIADPAGRAAKVAKVAPGDDARVEELYLAVLGRRPDEAERAACRKYLAAAASVDKGLQGIMWSLLNTREFVLQH